MPLAYIIEMLCDWIAVGMVKGTGTIEWYETDDHIQSKLTAYDRLIVERLLYKYLRKEGLR
jgi:hypothetical protein